LISTRVSGLSADRSALVQLSFALDVSEDDALARLELALA
jgi:hypothetical protein